jgi:hypothetical protein
MPRGCGRGRHPPASDAHPFRRGARKRAPHLGQSAHARGRRPEFGHVVRRAPAQGRRPRALARGIELATSATSTSTTRPALAGGGALARRSRGDRRGRALRRGLFDRARADNEFALELKRRNGIPTDVATAFQFVSSASAPWAPTRTSPACCDGETIALRDRRLKVGVRPGHSSSDTVFYDHKRRILVAVDHLLKHISSNPAVTRPKAA